MIAAFKLYVQEELGNMSRSFRASFICNGTAFMILLYLNGASAWHFKSLTVRHIYYPLAQSSGKLFELLKALKARDGDRAKKLFQFLNYIGARALRIQLGRVLEMAESSPDKFVYENKIQNGLAVKRNWS